MHITERTDIGLRLLLYLSVHEGRASVGVVANAFRVSEAHLGKVAQALAKGGFVTTVPGRTGGVELARSPSEIRVGDVVRALEPMELVECFGDENGCPVVGVCGLQPALGAAREAFLGVLDGLTLAEAATQRLPLRERLARPRPPRPRRA